MSTEDCFSQKLERLIEEVNKSSGEQLVRLLQEFDMLLKTNKYIPSKILPALLQEKHKQYIRELSNSYEFTY